MSGVPSVVAGVFIYAAILLTTNLRGSTFIGALPLAILMIPTVTRTAQEVLLLVPAELREAGLALGATQWRTVATIVVPAARSGLITAVILGVRRSSYYLFLSYPFSPLHESLAIERRSDEQRT